MKVDKKILFVDFATRGHHPVYMKAIVEEANYLGLNFCYAYPKRFSETEIYEWIDSTISLKEKYFFKLRNIFGVSFLTQSKLSSLASCLKRYQVRYGCDPGIVFLNHADIYLKSLRFPKVIKGIPWTGIWFHPRELRLNGDVGNIQAVVQNTNNYGLFFLDRGIIGSANKKFNCPIMDFPDLTDEDAAIATAETDFILKKSRGRVIIGAHGLMVKHKNILPLIEYCQSRPQYFFLFAGKFYTSTFSVRERKKIRKFLMHVPENALVINEGIYESSRFNSLHAICSILWGAYDNFLHSANRLTKSAMLRIPILVADAGYPSEVLREFQLGSAIYPHDFESIDQGIQNCLNRKTFSNEKAAKFFNLNSRATLRERLKSLAEN